MNRKITHNADTMYAICCALLLFIADRGTNRTAGLRFFLLLEEVDAVDE